VATGLFREARVARDDQGLFAAPRAGEDSPERVGHEGGAQGQDGLEFWGTSFLCDPFGIVMAEASVDKEEILIAEVSIPRMEEVRRNWPFLRDRRIDAYGGIEQRYLDR